MDLPSLNPYGLTPDVWPDPTTIDVPAEGERVGVRSAPTDRWLPFTVEMVTAKCVVLVSPINRSRFRFARDGTWEWRAWSECPAPTAPCSRCAGSGLIFNKKTDMEQACPSCDGDGRVVTHDPFTASH